MDMDDDESSESESHNSDRSEHQQWEVVHRTRVPYEPVAGWFRLSTRLLRFMHLRRFWGSLGRMLRDRGGAGRLAAP